VEVKLYAFLTSELNTVNDSCNTDEE
jgi:hypothetical protein